MMKIVLPTDFSDNAFHAISYAVRLFEKTTCIFYLVHAYTPPVYRVDYTLGSPGQMGLPDDHKYIAEEGLEKTRKRIKEKFDYPRHTFVTHAAFNTLDDEIQVFAQKENADMIIMGTQGATGAKEILFGSNTVHVIKKADIPVLAIPLGFDFAPPQQILFPTDFEIDFRKANLDFLLDFSKIWHSKIQVMHVALPDGPTKEQEENRVVMEGMMLEQNHDFHDLPDQELIEAINIMQRQYSIDLLAMVKNKHSFLERLFMEPVIKNIGLHSQIPFMVLPYNLKS